MINRLNKRFIAGLLIVLFTMTGLFSFYNENVYAVEYSWNDLIQNMVSLKRDNQHDLIQGIKNYMWGYGTIDTNKVYDDGMRAFDDIQLYTNSRITYGRAIEVQARQTISIVAAMDDTTNFDESPKLQGGDSKMSDAMKALYWCPLEYDEYGNLLVNAPWRDVKTSWTVGVSPADTQAITDANERYNRVKYIVPVFRLNNNVEADGSGMDNTLQSSELQKYNHFSLVTKPFRYTFKLNGGNYGGNTSNVTIERLGLTDGIQLSNPQRAGYKFVGWKLTSGGAEHGYTATSAEWTSILNDGKYYDSLFKDATFEAVWTPEYTFTYNANGGTMTSGENISILNRTLVEGNKIRFAGGNIFTRSGYKWTGYALTRIYSNGKKNVEEVFGTDNQWHSFTGTYRTDSSRWYKFSDGDDVMNNGNTNNTLIGGWIKNNTQPASYIIHAQWEALTPDTKYYNVTYKDVVGDKNGMLLGSQTKTVADGTRVSGEDLGTNTTSSKYYKGYDYNSSSSAVVSGANVTVYRFFKLHTYTINYNLQGGTLGGKTNPTEYTINTNTFTLNNPTKQGYTFIGWSGTGIASGTYNTKVTITKGSVGDRNYRAHYKPNTDTEKYGIMNI